MLENGGDVMAICTIISMCVGISNHNIYQGEPCDYLQFDDLASVFDIKTS
jgi:hypothetical protein